MAHPHEHPTHDHDHEGHDHGPELPLRHDEPLDPANQSLAEALRKSFRVLQLFMIVLVGLYCISGLFRVQPDEVGVVFRFGRIVGAEPGQPSQQAVLKPGWHLSWPYPVDQFMTVSTRSRTIPVSFMLKLSDEEKVQGLRGYKYTTLSPERDDYVITGDANILHVNLTLRYKIADPVAYLMNVSPQPDPAADARSSDYMRYPEYGFLHSLLRNSVIEAAAEAKSLDIRSSGQQAFVSNITRKLQDRLSRFERGGLGLGISVDPATGVSAGKHDLTQLEAIIPPRQVQEAFDRVTSAETVKSKNISQAEAEGQKILTEAAGPNYNVLRTAIDDEFEAMMAFSEAKAETTSKQKLSELQAAFVARSSEIEALLEEASGGVREILKDSKAYRDTVVQDAIGDHQYLMSILPEYTRNPHVLFARYRAEAVSKALGSGKIVKWFLPFNAREIRLQITGGGIPAGVEIPDSERMTAMPEDPRSLEVKIGPQVMKK